MPDFVPFQTRARTIDHLGREQIADVPTAVSELWKNAYDAYARDVSLHIYSDELPVAAIFDTGTGMSKAQFIDKWLVVGTESKITNDSPSTEERQGLSVRPKQGQKGIGRLSVAALGATVLVVTKKVNGPFISCLIDWRLFENPYLYLHEIRLPVIEAETKGELIDAVSAMRGALLENITGEKSDSDQGERTRRAWAIFDEMDDRHVGAGTTSGIIRQSLQAHLPYEKYLSDWPVWRGSKPSGTALIMSGLNSALLAWTGDAEASAREDAESIRASLIRTLTGFSDPYASFDDNVMNYEVVNHTPRGAVPVINREEGYGVDFLRSLDHCVEGEVDEYGVFRGTVRAFGKDLGEVELLPAQAPPTASRDLIGPFSVIIGSFEGERRSSTLDADVYRQVAERAQTHSGLALYRDGLRVMPYGRPENDFFKIEERRQMNTGREFWASRRLFGRIAITRSENPNLRDKAGREGLIDNTASRSVQILIRDLLKTTARRYYGSASPIRAELLPAIEAENDAAADKSKIARNSQLNGFRKIVRDQTPKLHEAAETAEVLWIDLTTAVDKRDGDGVWLLAPRVDDLVTSRSELRLPPKPRNLAKFEERYREYRDRFVLLSARVEEIRNYWVAQTEQLQAKPAIDVARSHLGRNQKAVNDRLVRWKKAATDILRSEGTRVDHLVDQDLKEFYKLASPLLTDLEAKRTSIGTVLSEMDDIRDRLIYQYIEIYEPYIRSLTQLSEGVDLDGAFAYAGAREATLERRLEQIQGLAQIGISVEILSHELSTLERRLLSSLSNLPESEEQADALREAKRAGAELVERLRFMSEIQVAGGDTRHRISGGDIFVYLNEFFGAMLVERDVSLDATPAFLKMAFQEFPSRIFPVFINLINNSLYWLYGREEKRVLLDAVGGALVLADSGPGVDPEDQVNLFELFFTRRVRGRGVGLYLCRQTLAAGGHKIEYITDASRKILSGANFVITLRNGFDG